MRDWNRLKDREIELINKEVSKKEKVFNKRNLLHIMGKLFNNVPEELVSSESKKWKILITGATS